MKKDEVGEDVDEKKNKTGVTFEKKQGRVTCFRSLTNNHTLIPSNFRHADVINNQSCQIFCWKRILFVGDFVL